MSELKKLLVVGSNAQLRNLVAAWFRKHADVFMSRQSIPDFISWAKIDPNVVFSGYQVVVVVVEDGEGASLSGLESFLGLTAFLSLSSSQVNEAMMNLNVDHLYHLVLSALERSNR